MEVSVRCAESADEDRVIAIILATMETYGQWHPGWSVPSDAAERELLRLRDDDSATTWLVGVVDGRLAGVSRWGSGEPATLSLLMVHPHDWHLGVGGALHAQALAQMTQIGSMKARLTVPQANRRARGFYERRGWRQTDAASLEHPWLGLPMLEYTRALCAGSSGS